MGFVLSSYAIKTLCKFSKQTLKIKTGASPGTFLTVSGTARMVPAEDLKVHIGSKQRVDIAYYP